MTQPDNIKLHRHDGVESQQINLSDLFGMIETVETTPTGEPTDLYGQVKLFDDSGTIKLYIYDNLNGDWRYVALT